MHDFDDDDMEFGRRKCSKGPRGKKCRSLRRKRSPRGLKRKCSKGSRGKKCRSMRRKKGSKRGPKKGSKKGHSSVRRHWKKSRRMNKKTGLPTSVQKVSHSRKVQSSLKKGPSAMNLRSKLIRDIGRQKSPEGVYKKVGGKFIKDLMQ